MPPQDIRRTPPSVIAAQPAVPVIPVAAVLPKAAPIVPEPVPKPKGFVAVTRIFVGAPKDYVEPGDPFKPSSDAERDLLLSQGVIREA